MPRPLIPLRRKDPWIGSLPPGGAAAPPARRVAAALVVAAAGLAGVGRGATRTPPQLVAPPRLRVIFGGSRLRQVLVAQRPDFRQAARLQGAIFLGPVHRLNVAVVQVRLKPPRIWARPDARFTRGRVIPVLPPRPRVIFGEASLRSAGVWRQPDFRFQRGQVLRSGVLPRLTVSGSGELRQALLVRQDRRGFAGSALLVRPPRPLVLFAPAGVRQALLVCRDQRGTPGRALNVRGTRSTEPLNLGAKAARVAKIAPGWGPGLFLLIRPPRPLVVFGPAGGRAARIARVDVRGFAGRVALLSPPRALFAPVVPRALVKRGPAARIWAGSVFLSRPVRAVVLVRPKPPLVVPQPRTGRGLALLLAVRRETPPFVVRPARLVVRQWLPERGRLLIVRTATISQPPPAPSLVHYAATVIAVSQPVAVVIDLARPVAEVT